MCVEMSLWARRTERTRYPGPARPAYARFDRYTCGHFGEVPEQKVSTDFIGSDGFNID